MESRTSIPVTRFKSTPLDYVNAIDAYKSVIDSYYHYIISTKPSNENVAMIQVYSNGKGSTAQQRSASSFLYDMVGGNVPFPVTVASYASAKGNSGNMLQVGEELRQKFLTDTAANVLSAGARQALTELFLELPIQYTAVFENGDTLTFVLDCITCSIAFLPLKETASDKNGNKLESQLPNAGSGSGDSRDIIYNRLGEDDFGQQLVCRAVSLSDGESQWDSQVCWWVYF